jgi:hypothetical protein
MFRSITFRSHEKYAGKLELDIGLLLECMLFYEQVTILANPGVLKLLLQCINGDDLAELIENGFLDVIYLEDSPGIMNHSKGLRDSVLAPIFFYTETMSLQHQLWETCIEVTGKSGKGRRLAQRLGKNIHSRKHGDQIENNTKDIFLNQDYVKYSFKTILEAWIPSLVWDDRIAINTFENEGGIGFESDLNFPNLTQHFRLQNPDKDYSITPELVLSKMLDAETHLYFSSEFLSEIVTDTVGSELMTKRVDNIASKISGNTSHRSFSEFIMGGVISFREAIRLKQISVHDAVKIIIKSQKFKEWLRGRPTEEVAMQEYMRLLAEETFLSTLPGKTVRFALFGGISAAVGLLASPTIGIGLGLSLNAFDGFLFDQFMNGWRPTQFVENELKKKLR